MKKQGDLVAFLNTRSFAVWFDYDDAAFNGITDEMKFRPHIDDADNLAVQNIFARFGGSDWRMLDSDPFRTNADLPFLGGSKAGTFDAQSCPCSGHQFPYAIGLCSRYLPLEPIGSPNE